MAGFGSYVAHRPREEARVRRQGCYMDTITMVGRGQIKVYTTQRILELESTNVTFFSNGFNIQCACCRLIFPYTDLGYYLRCLALSGCHNTANGSRGEICIMSPPARCHLDQVRPGQHSCLLFRGKPHVLENAKIDPWSCGQRIGMVSTFCVLRIKNHVMLTAANSATVQGLLKSLIDRI